MRPARFRPAAVRAILLAAVVGALVVGCTDASGDAPASSSPAPQVGTPTPTATAAPSPTSTPTATPFAERCDTLVPASALTGLFSDFARVGSYLPPPGSLGAQVLVDEGTVCGWQDTDDRTLMVAVAHLDDATLLAKKNDLVMSSRSVPTYKVEGYFEVVAGVGEAQAFLDPYWIVTTSVQYAEPGEAEPVIRAVLNALR